MAESEPAQVAARRQLGSELRARREQAGLAGQIVADQLGWSQSKVSRIEQARTLATVEDIRALLAVLGVPEADRRGLVELADLASAGSWRNSTKVGLTRRQQDFISLESVARRIFHYNPVLIPGYMQTEDYARQVIAMAGAANEDRALEYRLARRQTLLGQDAPTYQIVLMETALRWRPVEPRLMHEQLQLVGSLARRTNVELRVIPLDQTQSTFVQHTFMIFEFEDDNSEALVELTTQDLRLKDRAVVTNLRGFFAKLSSSALSPAASLSLVRSAAQSMKNAL